MYCLTRLCFGLNVAPLVMKALLNCVHSQDPDVKKGTSACIDDILVNKYIVKASRVEEHLKNLVPTSKLHERVADGARMLSLESEGSREVSFEVEITRWATCRVS